MTLIPRRAITPPTGRIHSQPALARSPALSVADTCLLIPLQAVILEISDRVWFFWLINTAPAAITETVLVELRSEAAPKAVCRGQVFVYWRAAAHDRIP